MKILSFSLDSQLLNKESVVATRVKRYGDMLEKHTVLVPFKRRVVVDLSDNTRVIGTGGKFKASQFVLLLALAFKILSKEKYDVVSSQDPHYLGMMSLLCAKLSNCGLEIQVHGFEKLNFFRTQLARFTLRRAGSLRVVSKRIKDQIINDFGVEESHIVTVPVHVDVSSLGLNKPLNPDDERELASYEHSFKSAYDDRFNILSVNRLVPVKNIKMQLVAIKELKDEFPDVLLHIVGEGQEKSSLEEKIKDLDVSEHVVLHGSKVGLELGIFYTQSNCFVLTSDLEGYGMVIVEAATAGLPIVMTDVGCAGEVVVHEESALIVPVRDQQVFTTSLRRIISDSALRERLSKAGEKAVLGLPTFDLVLRKYTASWQLAIQNK